MAFFFSWEVASVAVLMVWLQYLTAGFNCRRLSAKLRFHWKIQP